MGVGPSEEAAEWARRNGLGERLEFSHHLSRVVPLALFDLHPEFFPLIGGARWRPADRGTVNWNPDLGEPALAEHAAAAAAAYFAAHPEAVSFALGVNDGLRFGESEATLSRVWPPRYFRGRPDYSDLVFQFMNRAAERLGESWPEKHLGALAYYWCENVPSFPVHPKVLPFLTADRAQGYDRVFLREERSLQRRWATAGCERIGLYDYLYGHGFIVPRVHTRLIAEYLRHARRAGFTDYFAEATPNWGLDGPQPWLVAQLLGDPEQSPTHLLEEYYRRYYRAAAAPMRAFFEGCERRWMKQAGPAYWLKHFRSETQASLFPPEARRELRVYLQSALAVSAADPVAAIRVRQTAEAFAVSERFCELVETRDALARAVLAAEAGAFDPVGLAARLSAAEATRKAFVEAWRGTRERWPLALAESRVHDFVASDWAPAARSRLSGQSGEAGVELLPAGGWPGPLGGETRIAGLVYSPSWPERWGGLAEPWQGLATEWRDGEATGDRVVRLTNHKRTIFSTWTELPDKAARAEAAISVAGRGSPGGRVWLHLIWLSGARKIHETTAILPPLEGTGPWRMRLPGERPAEADRVALAVTVMDQQPGDWREFFAPSLKAFPMN